MKYIFRTALLIALLFGANALYAQVPLSGDDLSAIEATTPLSTNGLPYAGTYYSAANPQWAPLPGNLFGVPVWDLGGGIYLLDDLDGSSGGFHAMDSSGPLPPGVIGIGIFTNNYSYSIPTNGLWLWITNVANNTVYANLNGATDYVYEIYSTTNMTSVPAVSNWDIETEVFPGANTNTMPFTVPMARRNNLFLWARDWTGITNNGNKTPEWWFYYWFGNDGLSLSDNDLDYYGNTMHQDYLNTNDPNIIQFTIVASQYANTNMIPLQLDVSAGDPSFIALVDSTNFIPEGETWYPYTSSNFVADLDSSEGEHDLWIGLKSWQTNAFVTWQEAVVMIKTNAPVIIVTNPLASVVSQPLIQVQGLVDESLSRMTFDVSNAQQVLTNQTGYTAESFYDTNQLDFTNTFQLYDVRLTNGLNTITIHATDLAGNTTTTNLSVILDYSADTIPPALTIEWPQTGTLVSGSNFTLQAQVDDITATVTASIDGQTNTGVVQRNGEVRGLSLPLSAGTNTVTVTATDAAGNSVTTNLTLIQSTVTLTIDPISSDQANQSYVTVTGTVSDSNDPVTINDVTVLPDSSGNWNATIPVSPTGMATVNATANDPSGNPTSSQALEQLQPPMLTVASMTKNTLDWQDDRDLQNGVPACWKPVINSQEKEHWMNEVGGTDYQFSEHDFQYCDVAPIPSSTTISLFPDFYSNFDIYEYADDHETITTQSGGPRSWDWIENYQLVPDNGGEGQPGTVQTYVVLASATYSDSISGVIHACDPETMSIQGHQLLSTGITNGDDGTVSGCVVLSTPSGAAVGSFMPSSPHPFLNPEVQLSNLTLQIVDNNTSNVLSGKTTPVFVGQQMNLQCQLSVTNAGLMNSMLSNIQWTVPGDAISNYWVAPDTSSATVLTNFSLNNTNIVFYWVDGASNRTVQVSAMVNGAQVTGQAVFNIRNPLPQFYARVVGSIAVDTNYHIFEFDPENGNVDDEGVAGGTWLHFGINTSWTNVGIAFAFSNAPVISNPPFLTYGKYFLVQIVNQSDTKKNVLNGTNLKGFELSSHGLDTDYPFQSTGDRWHQGGYSTFRTNDMWFDSPTIPVLDGTTWQSRTDSFTIYLMFQLFKSNSIPVPMYSTTWSWAGTATTNSTPGSYTLSSSSLPSPIVSPTLNFPIWTINVTSFQFQTNAAPFNEN